MIMVADALPGCKRFLKPASLKDAPKLLMLRVLTALLLHAGRMSCSAAAGAIRCEPRHRGQISRFLRRPRWQNAGIEALLREAMLANERGKGNWVFILDATLCGQAGKKTENTYSTGNRKRRPRRGRRYGKYKHAGKSCHCFTMGLLIAPSGVRIPFCKPYHTREYCKQKTVRLAPAQGKYAVYRRLSKYRIGPKVKPRTYYVHQEKRAVHSIGEVRLVFSTTKTNLNTATPDDVKILLTNDFRLSVREVVELYSLRWQIELFFKELKSTLGFHQYKFRRFAAVEGWTRLVLVTFLYLEWYRHRELARRRLKKKEKEWWRCQRTYGLCQAVRLASQQAELEYLAQRLETPGGIGQLKRLLRNGFPPEYRAKL